MTQQTVDRFKKSDLISKHLEVVAFPERDSTLSLQCGPLSSLANFTISFEVQAFEHCFDRPQTSHQQIWLTCLCFAVREGKGFRLDIRRPSDDASPVTIRVTFGCGPCDGHSSRICNAQELSGLFPREKYGFRWCRITFALYVLPCNDKQVAKLFIDDEEVGHKDLSVLYVPPDRDTVVLGGEGQFGGYCELLHGNLRNICFFSRLIQPAYIQQLITQEATSLAHSSMTTQYLWQSRCFADCEVVADDGKRWQVHRCILASASSVFERMLNSDFKESNANIIIREAASADVETFLQYLYTGRLHGEIGTACSMSALLTLADMYQVENLMKLVASELEIGISVDNVVDTMRALHKRKAHAAIEPIYRRVSCRVRQSEALHECIMDSLS